MSAEKASNERELDRLIDRMCDQIASVDELAALGHRLADDPAARDYYIVCLELHARLAWQMTPGRPFSTEELLRYASEELTEGGRGVGGQRRGMAGSPAIDGEAGFGVRDSGFEVQESGSLSVDAAVELPSGQWPRTPNPEPPFPVLSTTHYPLSTTPFVGSWAFSCMVSAVILGVAALGGLAYKVTLHQPQVAEAPSKSVPSDIRPEMVFVGRITGMVDVKWSDDKDFLPPQGYAHVPLGRKYILSSGLLEITYDSGAKVILEGPCTYEVESSAGGYLALGKLTARVEKRGEGRGARGEDVPHSPLSPLPSPLFSVRTPTALVTDLGTEFGVEVSKRGLTKTQVFVGSVRLASIAPSGTANGERVLSAGQIGVVRSDNAAIVVADADGEKTFARVMPPPKDVQKALADAYAELVMSLGPVAYYRMERPNDENELLTVFDSAPGGRHGKLSGVGRAGGLERLWRPGRFGGGLELRGEFFGDYVIAPRTPDSDSNQYSFSAWILADSRGTWATFVSEGGRHNRGRLKFTLHKYNSNLCARVAPASGECDLHGEPGAVQEDRSNPLPLGQWRHVALVADGSVIHLYHNGVEVDSATSDGVMADPPGNYLLLGCSNEAIDPAGLLPESFWDGRIDEVAVFHRALSLEEVKRLYEGPAAQLDRGDDAGTARTNHRFNGKEVKP